MMVLRLEMIPTAVQAGQWNTLMRNSGRRASPFASSCNVRRASQIGGFTSIGIGTARFLGVASEKRRYRTELVRKGCPEIALRNEVRKCYISSAKG